MPTNLSLQRFKNLTEDLKKDVHNDAVDQLHIEALKLASQIKAVTPVYKGQVAGGPSETVVGALRESVRAIPDRSKDTVVRVVAGNEKTIHVGKSGKAYNYARAVEFGTQEMKAEPFFFPTYRLMKKSMIASMKRRISADIRKYSAE